MWPIYAYFENGDEEHELKPEYRRLATALRKALAEGLGVER